METTLNAAEGRRISPVEIEWGVATQALSGHRRSGDRGVVVPFTQGVLVGAVDGLGHGDDAAAATDTAVKTLTHNADQSVLTILNRCHEQLSNTRGVVMALASFWADGTMTWAGVGNIEAILLRADPATVPSREHLLVHGGVVGYQLPTLRASVLAMSPGDLLIFATDGIESGFVEGLTLRDPILRTWGGGGSASPSTLRRLADRIVEQRGKGTDDALVIIARYLGAGRP